MHEDTDDIDDAPFDFSALGHQFPATGWTRSCGR